MFFAGTGAVLDVVGMPLDAAFRDGWRARVEDAAAQLRWPAPRCVVRPHARGISLAVTAPCDQLFLATEVNEWALCAVLAERDPSRGAALEAGLVAAALAAAAVDADADAPPPSPAPELLPVLDRAHALARFERLAAAEANPRLREILAAANLRHIPHLLDDDDLTLGAGFLGRSFPLTSLPAVSEIHWPDLGSIPTALVTGSNGKTTTVRLLAACGRAHGWRPGYNCTDGVFVDGEQLASGDYSGPAGARRVIRDARTEAAILETARGGILRRGLAVTQADVAVVTNVSSDHFGEYGIDDLAGLADTKLTVAGVVRPDGLLVLNGDDAELRARATALDERFGRTPTLGWFALDADRDLLRAHRAEGGSTCGVRDGALVVSHRGVESVLGRVADMPLAVGGIAVYNIANLAGAGLAAVALGVPAPTVAGVFARFGRDSHDNPGRLMRFTIDGVQILIDYAHNPEGLRGFLTVAQHLRDGRGRLGLLLGHAGNRQNADIEAVARVAAEFHPDLVVVKENESQLRGRAPGEVPGILRAELLRLGFDADALPVCASEFDAVRLARSWARPGDVLALPLHSTGTRTAVLSLLESRNLNI